MKGNSFCLILTPILLILGFILSAQAADSCSNLIPSSLSSVIDKTYSGYRLPHQSDYDEYNVDYNLKNGGNGCLGIAKGHYIKKNVESYALNITSDLKKNTLMIVATKNQKSWKLEIVQDWEDEPIGRMYVETEKPGTYERTEALDGPISEAGERMKVTSKLEGIVAGGIESSGAVFFYVGKKWVHVWISD
jgi:hypothetical protein